MRTIEFSTPNFNIGDIVSKSNSAGDLYGVVVEHLWTWNGEIRYVVKSDEDKTRRAHSEDEIKYFARRQYFFPWNRQVRLPWPTKNS